MHVVRDAVHCGVGYTSLHVTHLIIIVFLIPTGKSPDTWDDMASESPVICVTVDLKADSIEYKQLLDAFNKTMSKGNDIVKIQRIQNPKLYSLYAQAKEQMDKTNPLHHQNERQLFHGTDATSAVSINTNGFNRTYAGKHGIYTRMWCYFHFTIRHCRTEAIEIKGLTMPINAID